MRLEHEPAVIVTSSLFPATFAPRLKFSTIFFLAKQSRQSREARLTEKNANFSQ